MADNSDGLTGEQVSWLMSENGKWFWKNLAEWVAQYRSDASRVNPMRSKLGTTEDYNYFRLSKDVASGRAVMCEDILAFVQEIVDSANAK
jgi:hypothetical protein